MTTKVPFATMTEGNVQSDRIQDSAVTTEKINNLAVTGEKIAANAVLTTKIGDNQVTNPKIANGIAGSKVNIATSGWANRGSFAFIWTGGTSTLNIITSAPFEEEEE